MSLNRVVLVSRQALAVGLIGTGLSVVGFLAQRKAFMVAYLQAYSFWIAIALGSLGYILIQSLVGGKWLTPFRPFLEASAKTIPWMALFFLPLVFGMSDLYLWTDSQAVAQDPVLLAKRVYLNVPAFCFRAALYFAIWTVLSLLVRRWAGIAADGHPPRERRVRALGAVGIILMILTVSFASFDWLMSLEPHWFSSIYGAIVVAGDSLSTMSFLVLLVWMFRSVSELASVPQHLHDVGKFMLMSVMLWAYLSFSQYLIIWAGNTAEEIPWYLHRTRGGWKGYGAVLICFHFAVPFLLLLSRQLKRSIEKLVWLSAFILFMRWLEIRWLVGPVFATPFYAFHWLDFTVLLGLGGLWVFLMGRSLTSGTVRA